MLRKSLFLSLCFCFLLAPMALAGGHKEKARSAGDYTSQTNRQIGLCYRDLNGQGEVISWVKNEQQCVQATNGLSWGANGSYVNINRN